MVGVLFSRHEAVIAAEVSGRLKGVAFELGQTVPAGAVVAHIDDRALREALARAEANLESAEADAKLRASERAEAEARYERRSQTADLYSPEELGKIRLERDRTVENHASALANARAQRANVAEIRLHLEAATIRAPFRGVVAARYQTPGTWLNVGAPVVRIVGEGELWVRFAAPPHVRSCFEPPAPIAVQLPEGKGELSGVVRNRSPEIDPASGLLLIEASLDVTSAVRSQVHSGLAVRVRYAGGSQH